MKKILIVACDGLSKSGVPNVFMNIMRNMDKTQYSFDVLYFNKDLADYAEEIKQLGCRLIYSNLDEKKATKIGKLKVKKHTCRAIKAIIEEYGPYDCVHSFKDLDSAYVLKAAYKCGVSCRISHMTFTYRKTKNPGINLIENRERKMIAKYADYIISDSTKTAKNNIPFSDKNIVVRNFCDSRFTFSELDKDVKPISLIQIGSFSFNKNQLFSILILKNLLKQYPQSVLHLIGFRNPDDLSYYDKIDNEIKNSHLENNVVFHDHGIDTNELFKKCHYLLFPSLSESFGIVPVEAQTAGLSCFCSDTVTRENDCGGCTYLPLNELQKWVEEITKDFESTKGKHRHFDLSGFSNNAIVEQYKLIYDNKYKK